MNSAMMTARVGKSAPIPYSVGMLVPQLSRTLKTKLLRRPFSMFDSVTVSEIPAKAEAVAGYVNGAYPTYLQLRAAFPHAKRLSISVNDQANADCLDVERGDATVGQAAGWVRKQRARGVRRPAVYCSLASAQELVDALAQAGIRRQEIRLWTAHYTHVAHRCGPGCGYGLASRAEATQWTDRAAGHNLDASLCAPSFL